MLIVTKEGGEPLKSLSLEAEISIGRGEGNVVRLDDRAVSRRHAIVKKTAEGVQIEKQSDFAPIRLNGVECTRALLKDGDVVEIGPYRMRLDSRKEEPKRAPERPAPAKSPASDPAIAIAPTAADSSTIDLGESASGPAPSPRGFGEPTLSFDPAGPSVDDADAQRAEALPTDLPVFTIDDSVSVSDPEIGDLTSQLTGMTSSIQAEPIAADSLGAESASRDPGSSIFDSPAPEAAPEATHIGIDFGMPLEAGSPAPVPVDENAATKVVKKGVEAHLELPPGSANVQSLDLKKSEVVIGRGKECDVVLNDKKSSRKNAVIARTGNRYVIRDLGSSNGTFVNGEQVTGERELSADDVIRIGEIEFRFAASSPEYERKKDQFQPADEIPAPIAPAFTGDSIPSMARGTPIPARSTFAEEGTHAHAYQLDGYALPDQGPLPNAHPAAKPEKKGFFKIYDKYIRNFASLKPAQKILVVLVLGFGAMTFLEEDTPVRKPRPKVVSQKGVDEKTAPGDYDLLSPEKKKQVDDSYAKALEFYKSRDFDKTLYEIRQKIYPIVPEWQLGKNLERYAVDGKRRQDAIEEEQRRKDQEAKTKARIAELEGETRELMSKRKFDEAKETFAEILTLDPENAAVGEWKKEIEAYMEEQARIEQERQVQEEINKRAWDLYAEAYDLQKAGKFRDAIAIYKRIPELGTNDERVLKKAATMVRASTDSIRELRDPHLKRAKELEASQQLAEAFKEFKLATEIDPPHPSGWAGMERIRDVLTQRAKVLYTEAVIAESYSDFTSAHTKFNEIIKTAPEGSLYYERAQRKLQSYLNFRPEEALQ
jgi:pSer/pThr/pTyr-binding forkhead associated (FHA) protein